MSRVGCSAIRILGIEGKKVNIIPTTKGEDGDNVTELYSKKEPIATGYMGTIMYSKKWKKYVLVELDENFMLSKACINEAFEMTESYWKKEAEQ